MYLIVHERPDLKGISIAKVKMIKQKNMGESANIFKPFPISFIDDHSACDPFGAGGMDGHARDIFEGGMDNADRTVSHNRFHV